MGIITYKCCKIEIYVTYEHNHKLYQLVKGNQIKLSIDLRRQG